LSDILLNLHDDDDDNHNLTHNDIKSTKFLSTLSSV